MSGNNETRLDVRGAVRFARRHWLWLLGFTLAGAVALFVRASLQEPVYEATATLLFRGDTLEEAVSGTPQVSNGPEADLPGGRMQTNLRLIRQRPVAAEIRKALRTSTGVDSLLQSVQVEQDGLSSLAKITASQGTPESAARLATTWARVYTQFRERQDRSSLQAAIDSVRGRLAGGDLERDRRAILQRRIDELETLATVRTGTVSVVEEAVQPSVPVAPRRALSTVIGALFGLLLGVGSALLREGLDRRIKEPSEFAEATDLPLLGSIPTSRMLNSSGTRSASHFELEPFRMLRANLLYFNVGRDIRSLLVTSAQSGDGKSTTAWNLAFAAAASGTKTLLIEADLRNPSLGQQHRVEVEHGLSGVLTHQVEFNEAVVSVPVDDKSNGREANAMYVLFAGGTPPNPTELVGSEAMRELLAQTRRDYEFIVVDTPPTTVVSDAVPLVKQVDGVVVVGRADHSTREGVAEMREQMRHLEAPLLGVVVNDIALRQPSYYGYGAHARD